MDTDSNTSVRIEIVEQHDAADAPDTAGDDGDGGGETIDSHLRRMAATVPDSAAIADPPNRSAYGMGPGGSLSYREADFLADNIAQRFIDHGLKPGDVIAIQLPNFHEGPLLIAAAWRARLVTVPIPMSWRLSELHHALAQLDAAAVVTTGSFAGVDYATTMRDVAEHHITVRYIFGLGENLCDGVTPIGDWFVEDAPSEGPQTPPLPAPAATDMAAMTWACSPNGSYPVPRTHAELLALTRIVVRELQFTRKDVVLSTYPLTCIASLCGLFLAPLLAGASIHLHQPFDYDAFVTQVRDCKITYTAIPASVIAALEDRGDLAGADLSLTRFGCMRPWPHGDPNRKPSAKSSVPVFDIHNLAELALVISGAKDDLEPAGLPLGKFVTAADDGDEEVYLETRVRGSVSNGGGHKHLHGDLFVRGTMVPGGPFAIAGALTDTLLIKDQQGYLNTHIRSMVDEAIDRQFQCEPNNEIIYHGGAAVGASELDRIYVDYPDFLDAAAFSIDDEIMGERIFAAVVPRPDKTPSLADFKRFLTEKGIAPFKAPDQLVVVNSIPRDTAGSVLRGQILKQV